MTKHAQPTSPPLYDASGEPVPYYIHQPPKDHSGDACLCLLAILLPFWAVFVKTGCSGELCVTFLLCLLGWLPAVLFAWWVIVR